MKKSKSMKLIDLYKEWMEKGELTDDVKSMGSGGLCNAIARESKYRNDFLLFWPDETNGTFWAYPLSYSQQQKRNFHSMATALTPLRQTIVLLICAMNDEL